MFQYVYARIVSGNNSAEWLRLLNFNIAVAKKIISWTVDNSVLGYNKTEANLQRILNSYIKTAA